MVIVQSLRKVGQRACFYNIDFHRPYHEKTVKYFTENQFDIVGISAVVSTSYSFVKYLAKLVREASPKSVIVVGGNLAASAEVLLRKCEVDFCVVSEGYYTIRDLIEVLKQRDCNDNQLLTIKGICFLDQNNQFVFTGYPEPIPAEQLDCPDYGILEECDCLDYYISTEHYPYVRYGLKMPEKIIGKKCAYVAVGQGCSNRCTFCHRWIKGYRMRPLEQIVKNIQNLKDRYDVGFIELFDESFGSDRGSARALVEMLGAMGMFWFTRGVRANSVTKDILEYWKKNGCLMVTYGNESFSSTMLKVMEKNVTVQQNLEALKWTYEIGLPTIVQLILGMPGETDKTIQETIDNMKEFVIHYYPDSFRGKARLMGISINYAMAFPGTPLYEYARQHGHIANNLDEEEQYLINISNVEAEDYKHFVNYTKQPLLKVLMWQYKIIYELNLIHVKNSFGVKAGFFRVLWVLFKKMWRQDEECKKLGISEKPVRYFKSMIIFNDFVKPLFYLLFPLIVAVKTAHSISRFVLFFSEYFKWKIVCRFQPMPDLPKESLRNIVEVKRPSTPEEGSVETIPLRTGRVN